MGLFLRLRAGEGAVMDNGVQAEILQRLTRVETKLDMQLNAKDIAAEALQSTKAAHHRLDDLKEFEDKANEAFSTSANNQTRLEKIEKWFTWLATTVFGAIILAIIGFLVTGGLKIK
jgi:hypothetical protein